MDYNYEPLEGFLTIEFAIDDLERLQQEKQPLRSEPWEEPDEQEQYQFERWLRTEEEEIKKLYQYEIENLEKKIQYFYGCTLSNYTHNYNDRLNDFTIKFRDTSEIDFIKEELDKGIFQIPYHINFIFDYQLKQFNFSLRKRFDFLKSQAESINYLITYIEPHTHFDGYPMDENYKVEPLKLDTNYNFTSLKWEGNQTELIELTKALILTGKVKGLQKDIISKLSKFFQLEIKNPDKIIQDIKNRNRDSETLFLDQLKKDLYNYIQEK